MHLLYCHLWSVRLYQIFRHSSTQQEEDCVHQHIGLKCKEGTSKVLLLENSFFYGAETWKLPKVDKKYLERFEIWCCRRMEKISWSDRVKN
jgi:hypothetical protein